MLTVVFGSAATSGIDASNATARVAKAESRAVNEMDLVFMGYQVKA